MSFITSAVAGPSRIPYGTAARVVCSATQCGGAQRRTYADNRREAAEDEAPTIEGGVGIREMPAFGDRPKTYDEWLYKVAYQYKRPGRGHKARWLGKEVPYASNPSFRPPPPLSNAFMSQLSKEMRAGKRTIGQISQAHNVSKHRLDAIRKLKEVEDEFVRQKLPLQYAFQRGMEDLLGVDRSHDAKATVEEKRQAELERLSHPSASVELQEEHDATERPGTGAFGLSDSQSSLERDVWEFQDEATYLANQAADAKAAAERKAEELADIAKGTDDKHDAKPQPSLPAHTAQAGKTVFRFIDTSKEKKQHK